jgi:hypothetical protein
LSTVEPYPRDLIGVDTENYSGQGDLGQLDRRHSLDRVLTVAAEAIGTRRDQWYRQDQGDGELALAPAEVSRPRLVDDWVRELTSELRRHNHPRRAGERMRLRVAFDHGDVLLDGTGIAGEAAVAVSRLLNSEQTRAALSTAPEADLVLILSDPVYRSVVLQRHRSLDPADFKRVHVAEKRYRAVAWVRVPGRRARDLPDLDAIAGQKAAEESRQPHQAPQAVDTSETVNQGIQQFGGTINAEQIAVGRGAQAIRDSRMPLSQEQAEETGTT